MADRYWIAGSSANWNDTANWSTSSGGAGGASVPGSSDVARFDGADGNCRLNVSINVAGLVMTTGYTGTIDGATDDLNHTIGTSDLVTEGSGTLSLGDGTWTCNGTWQCESALTAGSSTVVLAGTSKNWRTGAGKTYNNVTISGSYTGNDGFGNQVNISGHLDITGTLNVTSNQFRLGASATVDFHGTFSGTNSIALLHSGASMASVTNADGTITGPLVIESEGSAGTYTPLLAGTYGNIHLLMGNNNAVTVRLPASITVENLTATNFYGSGVKTLDLATNATALTVRGSVAWGTAYTWSKGAGTITLSGTADQSIDFNGESVEDIVINKSAGTVTLTGNVTTDSLTLTDGTLDIDGFDLTTTGNMDVAAGTSCLDTATGGLITVGGNFDIAGTSGNTVTWTGPDLDITGTATASYAVVQNSDATAGTNVTATNSTDNGGNPGWSFGGGGGGLSIPIAAYHYMHRVRRSA